MSNLHLCRHCHPRDHLKLFGQTAEASVGQIQQNAVIKRQ